MQKVFVTNNKKETWDLIPEILNNLKGRNIILLKGELGSGKTTLAQGVLKFLGAHGPFTSPTFVIMKAYSVGKLQITNYKLQINYKLQKFKFKNQNSKLKTTTKNYKLKTIFHIDCYRIGAKDMLELGWEEIINDKNNLVLVEWPERIKSILPEKYLQVDFKIKGENEREIKILKE